MLLKSLSAHIIAKLILADLLGTDDTTVTLLTPREGDGSMTARLWLYRGFDDAPYNAFHFTESAYLLDVLPKLAARALHPPPTNDDLDELLPDRWKLAHHEAVLKFRADERRQVDDRKIVASVDVVRSS